MKEHEILTKAYFESLYETVIFVQRKIFDELSLTSHELDSNQTSGECIKNTAIKNTFVRMHALALSISRLSQPVDVTAIATLFRVLFEQWIDIIYIDGLDADHDEFKKYTNFTIVKRWLLAKSLQNYEDQIAGSHLDRMIPNEFSRKFVQDQEQNVTNILQTVWGRQLDENTVLKHWTGKNLYNRIQSSKFNSSPMKIQATFEYKELYQWFNAFVHSGPEALSGMGADALKGLSTLLWPRIKEKYLFSLRILVTNLGLDKSDESINNKINYYENLHDKKSIDILAQRYNQES